MSKQETKPYKCIIRWNEDKQVHNIIIKFRGMPAFSLREHCERHGYTKCLVSISCSAVVIIATGSNNKPIINEDGGEVMVYDGETHIPLVNIYRVAIDYMPKEISK